MTHEPPDPLLRSGLGAVAAVLRTGRRRPAEPPLDQDEELNRVLDELAALYAFALAISQGDLEHDLGVRGSLAGALKSLHAALRHLTWQSQRVAAGDFTQRVDFMGEFSEAFNSMVVALETSRAEIEERSERLLEQAFRLEELATTDSLTGVFNRRKFNEIVTAEIERARRYGTPLSFLILDIDFFKRVNDTLGHEAGDQVLVALAGLLRAALRAVDSLARWGGEEFVVLLPEIESAGAARLAGRLRDAVHEAGLAGGVTVSFGVAQWRPDETADELFARADKALYRAKDLGRDRIEVAE
jgi:diguanylate cyclase (GGDEF)-like protein